MHNLDHDCILVTDESTEDALVEALIRFDLQKAMNVLVTDVLADGDVKTAKILQKIFKRFTETFKDSNDTNAIMTLISEPVIQQNLGKLMAAVSEIDPKHMEGIEKISKVLKISKAGKLSN